ncbi:MAG: phage tail tape measure protein, partial [Deltaproteobacteria bacterium]|nr:phage tail tape measure protein [Deltaproteobacteria bacterium]
MADSVIFHIKVDATDSDATLNRMKKGFKGLGSVGSKTIFDLGGAFKVLGKTATSVVSGIIKSFQKIGETSFEMLSDSVKTFQRLEDELIVVRRTAGLTAEQMKTMGDAMRETSIAELDGAVSANKLAVALGIAGQQGWISKAAMDANEGATVKFAQSFAKTMSMMEVATDMTLPKAAETLGMIHNVFKGTGPDIERLGSVINYFGNTMKVGQGIIAESSRRLALFAKDAGLSEAATVSLAATMVDLGLTSRQAGASTGKLLKMLKTDYADFSESFSLNATQFKQLVQTDMEGALVMLSNRIAELQATGPEGIEALNNSMKELRLTGDGISKVMIGLGNANETLNQSFKNGAEQWRLNTALINEFEVASSTLSARIQGLWSRLQELYMLIGEPLANAISKLIETDISPLIDDFTEWFKQSEVLSKIWPEFIDTVSAAMTTLLLNTRKWILEGGLDTFIDSVHQKFTEFMTTVEKKGAWEAFRQLAADAFIKIQDLATKVFGWVKEQVRSAFGPETSQTFQDWTDMLAKIPGLFASILTAAKGLAPEFEAIRKVLSATLTIATALVDAISWLRNDASKGPLVNDAYGEEWKPGEAPWEKRDKQLKNIENKHGKKAREKVERRRDEAQVLDKIEESYGKEAREKAKERLKVLNKTGEQVEENTSAVEKFIETMGEVEKLSKDSGLAETMKEAGRSVDEMTEAEKKLWAMINDTKGATEDFGETAFGNSVYPDTTAWIGKTVVASEKLNKSLAENMLTLSSMGEIGKHTKDQLMKVFDVSPAQALQAEKMTKAEKNEMVSMQAQVGKIGQGM